MANKQSNGAIPKGHSKAQNVHQDTSCGLVLVDTSLCYHLSPD